MPSFNHPAETQTRSPDSSLSANWQPTSHAYDSIGSSTYDSYDPRDQILPFLQNKTGRSQTINLLRKMLISWIMSAFLWGLIIALLEFTKRQGVLSHKNSYAFNVGITGLPLLLGVHTLSAYQKMAGWVRWRLLAYSSWTEKECDMILDLTSYQTIACLALLWCRRARDCLKGLLCIIWLCIMLGTEISLALLGFTYASSGDGALLTTQGRVRMALLDHFYFGPENYTVPQVGDFGNEQYLAHVFGTESQNIFQKARDISDIPRDTQPTYGEIELYTDGPTDWVYKFNDWTFLQEESLPFGVMSVPSERYVTITSNCASGLLKGWEIEGLNPDRAYGIWKMGTFGKTEWSNFGPGAVTFVNPDRNAVVPEPIGTQGLSTSQFCGNPRCASIGIYALTGDFRAGDGVFYECNITVSDIFNSGTSNQAMSDDVARLAAGSIGLDGIIYGPNDKDGWILGGSVNQFVRYNNDTLWGREVAYNFNHSTEHIARVVGGFAAGSIANLDRNNPKEQNQGRRVEIGVRVSMERLWIWIILGSNLGVHTLLIAIVLCLTYPIILPQESYIGTSRMITIVMQSDTSHSDYSSTSTRGREGSSVAEELYTYPLRRRPGVQSDKKGYSKKERLVLHEEPF